MNAYAVSALFHAAISLAAGLFILSRNPRHIKNITYGCFSFALAEWGVAYFLWQIAGTAGEAVFYSRWLMVGAIFVPIFYLHHVLTLLDLENKQKNIIRFCYGFGLVSAAGTVLTPLFVAGVTPKLIFKFWPDPGPLFHPFLLVWACIVAYNLWLIYDYAKNSQGVLRGQMRCILMGAIFGYGGAATNYFLWYNIPLLPSGHFLISLYVVLTAYAIIRHRLLEIEVIIRRTVVFAGLFAMVMAVVAFATAVTQWALGQYLKISSVFTTAVGVMIAIMLYEPCKKMLVDLTDRFLFQKKFSLTTMVAQASQAIALVQSLRWLARRIVAFLVTKCRIKRAVVYVRDRESGHFFRGAARGYSRDEMPPEMISAGDIVIRCLEHRRSSLELYRLKEASGKNKELCPEDEGVPAIQDFFTKFQAELVVPSFMRHRIEEEGIGKEKPGSADGLELRNILILGAKKSDEPYSNEEIEVFSSLAQESAIAIENARLYDEAVKKSRELAEMNRELENANERLRVTQASLIVAEKNATMVGMAKAIGHEINNPLTSVILPIGRIQKEYVKICRELMDKESPLASGEDRARMVKVIEDIDRSSKQVSRSAFRINAVVHTLTNILRDTKGEMEPLSLLVLCREAMEATRFSTYEENLTGCRIDLDVGSNLMILGNQEQLLQVFLNLIKNAYEAMENQRERRIHIKGERDSEDSNMARVVFSDNGPGIPQEVLPKIWTQGFSTKEKKEETLGAAGQGQGLFVCKHMIESVHKGRITVESTAGEGTRFIMHLPLAEGFR